MSVSKMSVSKEGKQLAAVVSCWPCRGFAVSPRADRCTSRSCPDFGQKSTPNHPRITVELFALSARQKPVELVMRGPAVVLAAALLWLISIGGAEAKLDILVDKATQRMMVIQDGYVRYMWPVSTGRDNMATPNGVYVPQRLERNWFSKAYYDSPMPYSIFFHNGYAIHGSYAIDRLGGPASHGCVRLHPEHAAILYDLVQQEGPENTRIVITGAPSPNFGSASPPNTNTGLAPAPGSRPNRNLNDLIETLQEQCNVKTGARPGTRPNPACVPYRAGDELADSHPNPAP